MLSDEERAAREWEFPRPKSMPGTAAEIIFPASLTPRQRWLVGLGALLSVKNNESLIRLHPDKIITANSVALHRQLLERAWDIKDHVGLLKTLVWLLEGGQRISLANQIGYPPLAWDYGRFVNLVRWGFAAGHVDEPSAWRLLEAVVAPVYRSYPGWSSFSLDFLIGRAFWLGKSEQSHEQALMRLWSPLGRAASPWQQIPWDAAADPPGGAHTPGGAGSTWDRYTSVIWTPKPVPVRRDGTTAQGVDLGSAERAVRELRGLAATDPARYARDLAAALFDLSRAQAGARRRADAFATAGELVELCRGRIVGDRVLVEDAANLALALRTAGEVSADPAVAVPLVGESAGLYRSLAAVVPDFRLPLVDACQTLAGLLCRTGLPTEADAVFEDALRAARAVEAGDPEAYRGAALSVMSAYAGDCDAVRRVDKAISVDEQAVIEGRLLAVEDPEAGSAALATIILRSVPRLAAASRKEPALAAFAEAIDIRRRVAAPGEPDLGAVPPRPGRPDEPYPTPVTAVAVAGDAVTRLRRVPTADSAVSADLARWLDRYAAELQSGWGQRKHIARSELAALRQDLAGSRGPARRHRRRHGS
jgi:Protein of unknown function (DUF1266)